MPDGTAHALKPHRNRIAAAAAAAAAQRGVRLEAAGRAGGAGLRGVMLAADFAPLNLVAFYADGVAQARGRARSDRCYSPSSRMR